MEIRKQFKFEMAHIVRQAWSTRCSRNIHGHSYLVEFFFKGDNPDNGQMIVDFGFLKKYINPFVDSFDHSFWGWTRPEDEHILKFISTNFERVIITPFSTTAEVQAKMFWTYADVLFKYLQTNKLFENGEIDPIVSRARVHETATGFAEYTPSVNRFPVISLNDIDFSEGIKAEWPEFFKDEWVQILDYERCIY